MNSDNYHVFSEEELGYIGLFNFDHFDLIKNDTSELSSGRCTEEVNLESLENFNTLSPGTNSFMENFFQPLDSDVQNCEETIGELPHELSSAALNESGPSRIITSKFQLLASRVCDLEEQLGIFNFAIWRMPVKNASRILVNLCKDILNIECCVDNFKVVRELNSKRPGVLVRVPSFEMKKLILEHRQQFLLRGYHVDNA